MSFCLQEHVKSLKQFQGLLLVPEPSNPHDPNAVAVILAADGKQIGYLPRQYSQLCTNRGTLPSSVLSTGPVQDQEDAKSKKELFGAYVWVAPTMVPLLPVALPPVATKETKDQKVAFLYRQGSLQARVGDVFIHTHTHTHTHTHIRACSVTSIPGCMHAMYLCAQVLLPGLCVHACMCVCVCVCAMQAALNKSNNRCELTGMSPTESLPLVAVPRWQLDHQKKTVKVCAYA